jgi:hypothetical protein
MAGINNIRPLVPVVYRRAVFGIIHNITYRDIRATRRLITAI